MDGNYKFSCEEELLGSSHKRECRLAPHCNEDCEAIAHQCMEVATPMKIEVTSKAKDVRIECGEPIICDFSEPDCHRKSSCEFVVRQCIDVKIPISYYVKTDVAESYVKCKGKRDC